MGIPITDTSFKPAPIYYKAQIRNSQVLLTDGNDANDSFSKPDGFA